MLGTGPVESTTVKPALLTSLRIGNFEKASPNLSIPNALLISEKGPITFSLLNALPIPVSKSTPAKQSKNDTAQETASTAPNVNVPN
jgi:hypothetical protein